MLFFSISCILLLHLAFLAHPRRVLSKFTPGVSLLASLPGAGGSSGIKELFLKKMYL